MPSSVVNAWTQWGRLETVVVGRADPLSCHLPSEPANECEINDPDLARAIAWPGGCVKSSHAVKMATAQLQNLCDVLEAEHVEITSKRSVDTELKREMDKKCSLILQHPPDAQSDQRVVTKHRTVTFRTEETDWSQRVSGPGWSVPSQYCATCPRDTMITMGDTILSATMSKRSRYFEYLACHGLALSFWRQDPCRVRYIAAPKPSMKDSMYSPGFWNWTKEERFSRMRDYMFCVNESEPVFDAADITRVGRDIFVQKSMTTNDSGIQWLTSSFPHLRVHPMHFPYDMHPSHIDCTFVPLRPPTAGSPGLVLINPERPPLQSESALWFRNDWKFVNCANPATWDRPAFSQSSAWLSMNLLSLSEKCVVIEENELPLFHLLSDLDFDIVTVPMRHMFDFGGAIHCCTWDVKRDDTCKDYFPDIADSWQPAHMEPGYAFHDVDVIGVNLDHGGKLLNPVPISAVGTAARVASLSASGR